MSQALFDPIALGTLADSPSGLSRSTAGVVSVVLASAPTGYNGRPVTPLAVNTEITLERNQSVGATDFNGSFLITALTDQQHFQYQQPSALGADTGGGGNLRVSPAQYTALADASLVQDAAFTSDLATQLQHNSLFAVLRAEVKDMGYFTHGDSIPLLVSPVDRRVYSPNECIYLALMGSSRQPNPLQFNRAQWQFPVLANADAGSGNLLESPQELHVSLVSSSVTPYGVVAQLTSKIGLGGGVTGQAAVRVICFGQRRYPSFTFASGLAGRNDSAYAAPPALPLSGLVGGNKLGQSKARQLSHDCYFGMVRPEFIDMGYFGAGDVVPAPVSPVDGYAYALGNPASGQAAECLFFYELASTLPPTGYTPGQLTFPSLGSDTGTGVLFEPLARLTIDANGVATGTVGEIICTVRFSTSGIANQGTVRVVAACQRLSAQAQQ